MRYTNPRLLYFTVTDVDDVAFAIDHDVAVVPVFELQQKRQ